MRNTYKIYIIFCIIYKMVSKTMKKTRKWSLKYKRSINCKRPRGFSQKQYCKYGRKNDRKTSKNRK